jgi:hypothetical protein
MPTVSPYAASTHSANTDALDGATIRPSLEVDDRSTPQVQPPTVSQNRQSPRAGVATFELITRGSFSASQEQPSSNPENHASRDSRRSTFMQMPLPAESPPLNEPANRRMLHGSPDPEHRNHRSGLASFRHMTGLRSLRNAGTARAGGMSDEGAVAQLSAGLSVLRVGMPQTQLAVATARIIEEELVKVVAGVFNFPVDRLGFVKSPAHYEHVQQRLYLLPDADGAEHFLDVAIGIKKDRATNSPVLPRDLIEQIERERGEVRTLENPEHQGAALDASNDSSALRIRGQRFDEYRNWMCSKVEGLIQQLRTDMPIPYVPSVLVRLYADQLKEEGQGRSFRRGPSPSEAFFELVNALNIPRQDVDVLFKSIGRIEIIAAVAYTFLHGGGGYNIRELTADHLRHWHEVAEVVRLKARAARGAVSGVDSAARLAHVSVPAAYKYSYSPNAPDQARLWLESAHRNIHSASEAAREAREAARGARVAVAAMRETMREAAEAAHVLLANDALEVLNEALNEALNEKAVIATEATEAVEVLLRAYGTASDTRRELLSSTASQMRWGASVASDYEEAKSMRDVAKELHEEKAPLREAEKLLTEAWREMKAAAQVASEEMRGAAEAT